MSDIVGIRHPQLGGKREHNVGVGHRHGCTEGGEGSAFRWCIGRGWRLSRGRSQDNRQRWFGLPGGERGRPWFDGEGERLVRRSTPAASTWRASLDLTGVGVQRSFSYRTKAFGSLELKGCRSGKLRPELQGRKTEERLKVDGRGSLARISTEIENRGEIDQFWVAEVSQSGFDWVEFEGGWVRDAGRRLRRRGRVDWIPKQRGFRLGRGGGERPPAAHRLQGRGVERREGSR